MKYQLIRPINFSSLFCSYVPDRNDREPSFPKLKSYREQNCLHSSESLSLHPVSPKASVSCLQYKKYLAKYLRYRKPLSVGQTVKRA